MPPKEQRAESREHCREQAAESREQTAQSKNSKLTVDLKTENAAKMEVRRLKNEAEGRLLGTLGKGITLVWAATGGGPRGEAQSNQKHLMFANTIWSQTRKRLSDWGWVGGVRCLAPLRGPTQATPPTRHFHPYQMSLKNGN